MLTLEFAYPCLPAGRGRQGVRVYKPNEGHARVSGDDDVSRYSVIDPQKNAPADSEKGPSTGAFENYERTPVS